MGMFKDMGGLIKVARSDELKDMRRKAGAQPKSSLMDAMKLGNEALDQAPVWQQQGVAGMADMNAAATYGSGIAGRATVNSLAETGTVVNNAPVMELDLTVTVPGRDPYGVKHRQLVAYAAMGNFQAGSSFPVHVDQQDPSKIVLG